MFHKPWRAVLLLTLMPLSAQADHPTVGIAGNIGGPIITSSANVMEKGRLSASIQYLYLSFEEISETDFAFATANGIDAHSASSLSRTAFNLSYGFTDRLTMGISVPHIRRTGLKSAVHEHHEDEDVAHDEDIVEDHHDEEITDGHILERLGNAGGLGDTHLFGAWQLSADKTAGNSSLLFGVKVPTGSENETSLDGVLIEAELQPGSGSWDPFIGLAYSRQLGGMGLSASALYTFANTGS